jgi:hypothetical protein
MMSKPRRSGPSKAATDIGQPPATLAITLSRSGSIALKRSILHDIAEVDQSSRHIALERRVGE